MNKMNKARKKITALLLTGCLCVAMVGSYALASTEHKIVSGDGTTLVKGSGEDLTLVIEGSAKEVVGVNVDSVELSQEEYQAADTDEIEETPTTEVPETTETPTTEVPETTEAPTTEVPETTEAPTTTEVPTTTEAPVYTTEAPVYTTEAPVYTTEEPVYTSEAPYIPETSEYISETSEYISETSEYIPETAWSLRGFAVSQVQAAEVTVTVTLNSSYLETLSVGTHEVTVDFTDGSATASFTIQDEDGEPEDEDTTEEEDTTEATTADDGKGDSPDQTTTSDSAKTGDSTPIGIFLALAVCSGAVIVFFGRKKITK